MKDELSRRQFVRVAGAMGAALYVRPASAATLSAPPRATAVLFQGDSVTDNFHTRTIASANNERALGTGYPLLVAAAVLREHPDRNLSFFNRGVSGNKLPDLVARWRTDTLDLKPDVLSVLIGVNDFWHTMLNGYAGTLEQYEQDYLALLQSTRSELPGVRFVVMEPFALPGKFVDERWYPAFSRYQAAARRVAEKVAARFVPLQDAFDKQAKRFGAQLWTADGVHPTPAGHALIAERWRKVVEI